MKYKDDDNIVTAGGPFAKCLAQPQLMFVKYNSDLHSTMKRFRKTSELIKAEKKKQHWARLNGKV